MSLTWMLAPAAASSVSPAAASRAFSCTPPHAGASPAALVAAGLLSPPLPLLLVLLVGLLLLLFWLLVPPPLLLLPHLVLAASVCFGKLPRRLLRDRSSCKASHAPGARKMQLVQGVREGWGASPGRCVSRCEEASSAAASRGSTVPTLA